MSARTQTVKVTVKLKSGKRVTYAVPPTFDQWKAAQRTERKKVRGR